MLIAIGPDVTSAQDYTERIAAQSIQIQQNQGDTLDTFKCIISDPFSQYGVSDEDELYVLEESDPNGWPTTNLLINPAFSGTYNNGGTTVNSWTISPYPSTGVSFSKSSTGGVSGGVAQQIAISNMSVSTPTYDYAVISLPQDEFSNPLVQYPYYFSVYMNQTVAPTNLNMFLRIDWYDINDAFLSSSSVTTIPAAASGYIRYWCNAAPPSAAYKARARIAFQGTSATNSGTFIIDNAQFEYATFYSYQAMGFAPPLINPNMEGVVANAYCTGWSAYNATNTAPSVVSSPALHNAAQQIILTNVTPSSTICGIQQQQVRLYKLQNYTLTLKYFITSALSANMQVSVSMHMYDNALNDLGNFGVQGPLGEGITNVWQTLSLRVGPGLANPLHPSAVYFAVHLGLVVPSGSSTNSGGMVIGEFDFTPDIALQYAGLVGIYPTPYCDSSQPGCYFDSATSRPYRAWRYFGGFVKNAIYDYSVSGDRYIEVDANDFSILLQEAPATVLILNTTDVAAIKQACDYAANQGFLAGLDYTTHVTPIGKVNAMLFNWRTTRDVITEISNQTIAAFYVDPYKFLWYEPALATNAPFGLSDVPDPTGNTVGIPTYQMSGLRWNQDSTETVTAPVIEGSTQLSAPQTFTGSGSNTTTTSDLLGGDYNYIPLTSAAQATSTNNTLFLWDGTHFAQVTVASNTSVSATLIPISTFTPTATISSGAKVALVQTQLTAALNSGTAYTSISVNAIPVTLTAGTFLVINDGTHTLQVQTTGTNSSGATTVTISSVTPSSTIASNASVGTTIGTTTHALSTTTTTYTSLAVASLPQAIVSGSVLFVTDGTTTLTLTTTALAAASATSISVNSFTPGATLLSGATVAVDGYVLNNNNPIAQIDSVTVGGVAQGPIGLFSTNSYAQGYTCLVDLSAGILYFQNAPASGSNNVVIIYRYASPVIVRITVPYVGGPTHPRRKIHSHQKEDHITSQQAAIDRANAEIAINAKAKPVGDIILMSPNVPMNPGLHAGQAIQVWFAKANQTKNQLFPPGQLFQIQSCQIQPLGNGVVKRTLKVGFYMPDFAIYMAQIQRDNMESTDNNNTVLQDVLTNNDSKQLTDNFIFTKLNTASWYSGTPLSSSFGWGPVTAPRVLGVWG